MHDEIRIAADRRREVRVGVGRQAEVAEIRRVVPRLLHRPQHQERDRLLFRLAAQSSRRAAGNRAARARRPRRQRIAQRRDELLEDLDLRRIGLFVNAIERRHAALLEMRGDRFVGEQHELLDEPVRDVPLRRDDRLDQARRRRARSATPADRNRSSRGGGAARCRIVEQLVHPLEHRHERPVALHHLRIAIGQNRVDVRVGHPLVAVDHAVVHFVADDARRCGDRLPSGTTAPADRRADSGCRAPSTAPTETCARRAPGK